MAGTTLLDNVNIASTGVGVCGNRKSLVAYVWGTDFGGGTVTIQSSPDEGTTWFTCKHAADDDDAVFTDNEVVELQPIGSGAWIRAVLGASVSPSGVNVKVL